MSTADPQSSTRNVGKIGRTRTIKRAYLDSLQLLAFSFDECRYKISSMIGVFVIFVQGSSVNSEVAVESLDKEVSLASNWYLDDMIALT